MFKSLHYALRREKIRFKNRELNDAVSELELILTLGSSNPKSFRKAKCFDREVAYHLKKEGYITYSDEYREDGKQILVTVPETTDRVYASLTNLGEELYKIITSWLPTGQVNKIVIFDKNNF